MIKRILSFLQRHAGRWNGSAGGVENAIVDDEFGAAIDALRAKGAFVWVVFDACHSGTMDRGAPSLSVTVVPDSGTGALTGLRGSLNITIREGVHCYGLDYSLDAPA